MFIILTILLLSVTFSSGCLSVAWFTMVQGLLKLVPKHDRLSLIAASVVHIPDRYPQHLTRSQEIADYNYFPRLHHKLKGTVAPDFVGPFLVCSDGSG